MFKNILAAGSDEGGTAHQDKGVGANIGQVMEVNRNIEKDDGNLEDLSDNVATKDSGEADRHRLGEVDEISNNAIVFHVLDNKTFDGATSSFLAADNKVEGDTVTVDEKVGHRLGKGGVICSMKN